MSSASAVGTASKLAPVEGAQRPRICHVPPYVSSTGAEAIEVAELAGLDLDPWQEFILTESLGENADGSWAAFEVGVLAPRQNGKNSFLEARELAGLFLLDERLIIHTAHLFDTSVEQFARLLFLIEDTPEFDRRVDKVSKAHGAEAITLKKNPRTGLRQRITFRTRTRGGGRGFTGSLLVFDEAMILPEATVGALLPTLSAVPNPQVLYTGSAVDKEIHEDGVALARLRERGIKGTDPGLAYFDFSAAGENPDALSTEDLDSLENWRQANPGLGIRISPEHIAKERRSMDPRTFAVERLGVGDWPRTDGLDGIVITPEAWKARTDEESAIAGRPCFAIDVTPDRARGAIGAGGFREDQHSHVEMIEHKRGTGWIAQETVHLVRTHRPVAVVLDASGPAATLVPELNKALREADGEDLLATLKDGELTLVTAKEHAQACGMLYDGIDQGTTWHLDEPDLTAAIKGAVKRPLGDSWAWSRKNSAIDISPLVAITLAQWGSRTLDAPRKPEVIDLGALQAEMEAEGEL